MRESLLGARVVVLPVRDNTYSGATTVLLQAMACGKPVVVTKTAAIARGYDLDDGENCLLVPPGDLDALETRSSEVLGDLELAASLGRAPARRSSGISLGAVHDAIRDLLSSPLATAMTASA